MGLGLSLWFVSCLVLFAGFLDKLVQTTASPSHLPRATVNHTSRHALSAIVPGLGWAGQAGRQSTDGAFMASVPCRAEIDQEPEHARGSWSWIA